MHYKEIILRWKKASKVEAIPSKIVGVYQIYGIHISYGPDKLLYIGKSDDIMKRLGEHDYRWLRKEQDLNYRYAAIDEKEYLDDIESLLIFTHSPFYNSSKVSDFKVSKENIVIYNVGERETLVPEIPSRYWEIFRKY